MLCELNDLVDKHLIECLIHGNSINIVIILDMGVSNILFGPWYGLHAQRMKRERTRYGLLGNVNSLTWEI